MEHRNSRGHQQYVTATDGPSGGKTETSACTTVSHGCSNLGKVLFRLVKEAHFVKHEDSKSLFNS